jgi:hypothetical protein
MESRRAARIVPEDFAIDRGTTTIAITNPACAGDCHTLDSNRQAKCIQMLDKKIISR